MSTYNHENTYICDKCSQEELIDSFESHNCIMISTPVAITLWVTIFLTIMVFL